MMMLLIFLICIFALSLSEQSDYDYEYIIRDGAFNIGATFTDCEAINASLVVIENENQNMKVLEEVNKFQERKEKKSTLDLIFGLSRDDIKNPSTLTNWTNLIINVTSQLKLQSGATQIGFFLPSSSLQDSYGIKPKRYESQTEFNQKLLQILSNIDNLAALLDTEEYFSGIFYLTRTFESSKRFSFQNNSQVLVQLSTKALTSGEKNSITKIWSNIFMIGVGNKDLENLSSIIGLKPSYYNQEDYSEHDLVQHVVHDIKLAAFEEPLFWIGLLRSISNSKDINFLWHDGTQISFSQWANNAPTNGTDEYCGVMSSVCCPSSYKWVNVECGGNFSEVIKTVPFFPFPEQMNKPRPYICQRITNKTTTTQTTTNFFSNENFCRSKSIERNGMNFTFKKANFYETSASTQFCQSTGFPMASVQCKPNTSPSTNRVHGIFDLSTLETISCNITLKNLSSTPEGLAKLSVLTSNPSNLTQTDVDDAVQYLKHYASQSNKSINLKEFKTATVSIGNLVDANLHNDSASSKVIEKNNLLLESLNQFSNRLSLQVNESTINIKSNKIDIQFKSFGEKKINDENIIPFQLDSHSSSSEILVNITRKHSHMNNIKVDFVYVASINMQVLEDKYIDESQHISNQVISIGMKNNYTSSQIKYLVEYKNISFRPIQKVSIENPVKSVHTKVNALFFNKNHWKICSDCHFKSFSPLIFQSEKIGCFTLLFSSKTFPSTSVLTIFSYVGIGISSVFLVLTIVIYLTYKNLRTKSSTPALINICVLLLLVYLVFAAGIGRTSNEILCEVFSVFLHFLFLSFFLWMMNNAILMYLAFTTLKTEPPKSVYFYFLAYGLSFLVVTINYLIAQLYLDPQRKASTSIEDPFFESSYRASFMCWLQPPSLYWGFYLPVGIMIFINFCIYIILAKKAIFQTQKTIQSTVRKRSLLNKLTNAIVMFLMMGLNWVSGYFLLIPENISYEEIAQWLFTITTSLQGFVISLLFCFRSEEVRNMWLNKKLLDKFLRRNKNEGLSLTS